MRSRTIRQIIIMLFSYLALYVNAIGKTLYVDDSATGTNTGISWSDAYNYLQDALSVAVYGDEILVAQGVYNPDQGENIFSGDRAVSFNLVSGTILKGGYAGFGNSNPNERNINLYKSILSGDLNKDDPNFINPSDLLTHPERIDNSYHVLQAVTVDSNTIIDGFVISGGNTTIGKGGGLECYLCVALITNCNFSQNAADSGGAIDGFQSGWDISMRIENSNFISNFASSEGGAINNEQGRLSIQGCIFENNNTESFGGALCLYATIITLERCYVQRNTALQGGGIANYSCELSLSQCVIAGNKATGSDTVQGLGGGILNSNNNAFAYNVNINNCTFTGNIAQMVGGGIFSSSESNTTLSNCIFWNNGDEVWSNAGTTIEISYSDVSGGWLGLGNINADPMFIDPNGTDGIIGTADDNLRLSSESPCIDAGDNTSVPVGTIIDLNGFERFINDICIDDKGSGTAPIVDMGAYEFLGSDIDSNGNVSLTDFSKFALYWLDTACAVCGGADLTCDGSVDEFDLNEFTDNWLEGSY